MAQPQMRARSVYADYLPGPYGPADEDLMECQMLLARATGIDGFLGPWTFGDPATEHDLVAVTRVALRYGVHVGATWSECARPDDSAPDTATGECFVRLLREVYGTNGVRIAGHPLVLLSGPVDRRLRSTDDGGPAPASVVPLAQAAREAGYSPVIVARETAVGVEGSPEFLKIVQPGAGQCQGNQWELLQTSSASVAVVPEWMSLCHAALMGASSDASHVAIVEWARRIASWKGTTPRISLLALPERLLGLRRRARGLAEAGVPPERVARVQQDLYDAALSIARYGETAAQALMKRAETETNRIDPREAQRAPTQAAA